MKGKVIDVINEKNIKPSNLKWTFGYAKTYIPQIILILVLNAVVSLSSIGMSLLGKQMIDQAEAAGHIKNIALMYVLVVVVSLLIQFLSTILTAVISEKFAFRIRKSVYEKVLHTCWVNITKYHTGDLMTRLTSDINVVSEGITSTIPYILQLLFELVVTFITLAVFDWKLAVFALLIAPIAAICSMWLGRKIKKLQVKVQESESKYRSFLQESLANILIVKSFCTEDYAVERLSDLRDERLEWILKKNRAGAAVSLVLGLAFQLGYIAAFVWGTFGIANHTITFGTMTVFLTLVNRIQSPIMCLAQTIPKVTAMFASAGRIIQIQDLPVEEKNESNISTESIGVKVEKVDFGYTDELVLNEASVDFKPGEFTAIVGTSGIGKTTLVRLIMSFANAAAGNIKFYNNKNQTEDANALTREFISYVPQGNTLFSGTILENILMGKRDATSKEIEEALKGAAAYDFVKELPEGLNTVIGEKGYGLSEGQAQRIAIARALIKKAPFLILDEATSSLDEKTELEVLEGIRSWSPVPTCLLITHRRSVLRYCDREICIRDKKMSDV